MTFWDKKIDRTDLDKKELQRILLNLLPEIVSLHLPRTVIDEFFSFSSSDKNAFESKHFFAFTNDDVNLNNPEIADQELDFASPITQIPELIEILKNEYGIDAMIRRANQNNEFVIGYYKESKYFPPLNESFLAGQLFFVFEIKDEQLFLAKLKEIKKAIEDEYQVELIQRPSEAKKIKEEQNVNYLDRDFFIKKIQELEKVMAMSDVKLGPFFRHER